MISFTLNRFHIKFQPFCYVYTLLKKINGTFWYQIFIERYPLKRCQGCVKLIASKVNCFLNINDLSEVQLCMSSNSWTWECPHTKDGADHVPLILLSSVITNYLPLKGQYRHDQSRLSTGHGIDVL